MSQPLGCGHVLDHACYVIVHVGKIRARVRVRVFHHTFYSAPHGSTTTVRFSCKYNYWGMFRIRVRVTVFHRTVYSEARGNTTTVRFSCKCNCWPMFYGQGQGQGFSSDRLQCATWQHNNCQIQLQMQLLAHVLGLGLGLRFFIVPFIVNHMATQQLLHLVANATAGPCFTVRVRVRVRVFHRTVYSAPHGSTTIVRFSSKCNCWPMFQGQGFPSYMLNMFQGQGQGYDVSGLVALTIATLALVAHLHLL